MRVHALMRVSACVPLCVCMYVCVEIKLLFIVFISVDFPFWLLVIEASLQDDVGKYAGLV